MSRKIFLVVTIWTMSLFFSVVAYAAPFAYITNEGSNNVTIINASTYVVSGTVSVGTYPSGVVVHPSGTPVYVTNWGSNNVSIIDRCNSNMVTNVNVGTTPRGVAIDPTGSRLFVTNLSSDNIYILDAHAPYSLIRTISLPAGSNPGGIVVDPRGFPTGGRVFVANRGNRTVSIISANISTDTYTINPTTLNVGGFPWGMALTDSPYGMRLYVANYYGAGSGPGSYGTVSIFYADTFTEVTGSPISMITPSGAAFSTWGVAADPFGKKVYITNSTVGGGTNIKVIDNTLAIPAVDDSLSYYSADHSTGVSVTPDGFKVFIANYTTDPLIPGTTVSVIDNSTFPRTTSSISLTGQSPYAFGQFIGADPVCGTPPPPSRTVGYNPQWLIITLVSLSIAGGLLLRRRMRRQ